MQFWQPHQKNFFEKPQIWRSDSEKDGKNYEFFEKMFFLKMILCKCRVQLWQTCQKTLFKTLKTSCWKSGKDEKMKNFPKNHFSSRSSSEHVQRNFDKPAVKLLPKTRKTFPNSKKDEVTIFWSEFFFHQKRSSSNRECNPDNPTKKFCPKNYRCAAHIPINDEKNYEFFERKIFFFKLCFCTCRI